MDTAGSVSMVPNPEYGGPVKPTAQAVQRGSVHAGHCRVQRAQGSATSASERDGRLRIHPAGRVAARSLDAQQRLHASSRGPPGRSTYFAGELHQPDERTDLRAAVLPPGDAGPGRPEHLHHQGVLRIRVRRPTVRCRPSPPRSSSTPSSERIPYPYNPTAAVSLLKDNGWTVRPGWDEHVHETGHRPRSSAAPGVRLGQQAAFTLKYVSNDPTAMEELAQLQVGFRTCRHSGHPRAGLPSTTSSTMRLRAIAGAACTWDLAFWDSGWIYAPDYYPTGDEQWGVRRDRRERGVRELERRRLLRPAGGSRHRRNRVRRHRSRRCTHTRTISRSNLPVIWFPVQAYRARPRSTRTLKGVGPLDPLLEIYPENWRWS